MANTLTPSSLIAPEIGDSYKDDLNSNWNRLNNTLLKLSELLDVDDTGKGDGDILRYNSTSQKFEAKQPSLTANTTTTTTTSTTTTTTL